MQGFTEFGRRGYCYEEGCARGGPPKHRFRLLTYAVVPVNQHHPKSTRDAGKGKRQNSEFQRSSGTAGSIHNIDQLQLEAYRRMAGETRYPVRPGRVDCEGGRRVAAQLMVNQKRSPVKKIIRSNLQSHCDE